MAITLIIKDTAASLVLYYDDGANQDMIGSFPRSAIARAGLIAAFSHAYKFYNVKHIEIDVGLEHAQRLVSQIGSTGKDCFEYYERGKLKQALLAYIKRWETA